MLTEARNIIVQGRVQGVGFRFFVYRAGMRLGLQGSVRNCADGSVEITAEGPIDRLEEFIREVRKGPPQSRVESVSISEVKPAGSYSSFQIEGW